MSHCQVSISLDLTAAPSSIRPVMAFNYCVFTVSFGMQNSIFVFLETRENLHKSMNADDLRHSQELKLVYVFDKGELP